jgi:hypothetical protein
MSDLKKKIRKAVQEQIQYDGPERMDREVERKISSGETPLSDNPAFPGKDEDEFDNSFAELVASERFKEVVEKVKRYTGMENISGQNAFMQLQMALMGAVQKAKSIESNNEGFLEQLAVDLVKQELSIPDDAFQYDNLVLTQTKLKMIWKTSWLPLKSLIWKRLREDLLILLFKERLRKVTICSTWLRNN